MFRFCLPILFAVFCLNVLAQSKTQVNKWDVRLENYFSKTILKAKSTDELKRLSLALDYGIRLMEFPESKSKEVPVITINKEPSSITVFDLKNVEIKSDVTQYFRIEGTDILLVVNNWVYIENKQKGIIK